MNMPPHLPNLLPFHNYHIIETRYKKHIKLYLQKEKSMAARNAHDEHSTTNPDHFILSQLNLTHLSSESSEKEDEE
jgi:hypothetical protein